VIARLSLHRADGADPRKFCLRRQHLMFIRTLKEITPFEPKHATTLSIREPLSICNRSEDPWVDQQS